MLLTATTWADTGVHIFEGVALILIGWLFVWIGRSIKHWVEDIVAEMTKTLETRTAPIQPGANGGKSLPDAIELIREVDRKTSAIHNRIDTLHEKVNGIGRDFEHLRGRFDQHLEDTAE